MVRTVRSLFTVRAGGAPLIGPLMGPLLGLVVSLLAGLVSVPFVASRQADGSELPRQRVQFDLPAQSAARDVTPVDFATSKPQERLIAVRLPVSVISQLRDGEQLDEVWIRVESPDESLRVEDYAPRTTLSTSVQGTMRMEGSGDHQKEVALQLRGQSPGLAEGSLTALDREQGRLQYEFEVLPPLELGLASGTLRRGQGVYFKFRSSPRAALEGELAVEVVFRVAEGWRGDRLYVHGEAIGSGPGFPGLGNQTVRWGARSFVVALYLDGDMAAHRVARQYLEAESDYRDAIGRWAKKRSSNGNPLSQISAALLAVTSHSAVHSSSMNSSSRPSNSGFSTGSSASTRDPRASMLESVVYARGTAGRRSAPDVPAELRDATAVFVASQRQLDRLSVPSIERLPAGPVQVPPAITGASITSAADSARPHSGGRSRGPR